MKMELSRISYVDAFGDLLDVAGDSTKCVYQMSGSDELTVGRHFSVVGDRLRDAFITVLEETETEI